MKKVTIMVTCYNEEDTLPLFYEEAVKVMDPSYQWELLFVNDGSSDSTLRVIQELQERDCRVSYVDLARNYGKEKAMLAGFDHTTGDALIIMDADLQDPPSLVGKMLAKWEEGYDDVYAHRATRGEEPLLRRWFSKTFYRILQHMSDIDVLEDVGDFRLLDRKCVDALIQLRESERYTKGLFCHIGFNKIGIDFDRGDRVKGTSKWSFWKLFGLAIEGIVSYSNMPLRIATLLGVFISFIAFALGIFYICKTLIFGDPVSGFPTLATLILFLGGVQLIGLGIIGEYIGRIFIEAKRRPVYNVKEYVKAAPQEPEHETLKTKNEKLKTKN